MRSNNESLSVKGTNYPNNTAASADNALESLRDAFDVLSKHLNASDLYNDELYHRIDSCTLGELLHVHKYVAKHIHDILCQITEAKSIIPHVTAFILERKMEDVDSSPGENPTQLITAINNKLNDLIKISGK